MRRWGRGDKDEEMGARRGEKIGVRRLGRGDKGEGDRREEIGGRG